VGCSSGSKAESTTAPFELHYCFAPLL